MLTPTRGILPRCEIQLSCIVETTPRPAINECFRLARTYGVYGCPTQHGRERILDPAVRRPWKVCGQDGRACKRLSVVRPTVPGKVAGAGAHDQMPAADAHLERTPVVNRSGLDDDRVLVADLGQDLIGTSVGVFAASGPEQIAARPQ